MLNGESELRPFHVTDTLDLHGFFPEQAAELVTAFIEQAVERKYQTVRIIHGKGKSRMKWEILQILKNHPAVITFRDAPPDSGHWGVTVVEIRTDSANKGSRTKKQEPGKS